MRRSTVVILPLRLAVPGLTNLCMIWGSVTSYYLWRSIWSKIVEEIWIIDFFRWNLIRIAIKKKFQKLCLMLRRHNICPNDDSSHDISKSCIMFLSSWHIHILLGLCRTLASNRPKWEHEPSHRSPIEFYYSGHSPSSYKAQGTSIRQKYISFTWLSLRDT